MHSLPQISAAMLAIALALSGQAPRADEPLPSPAVIGEGTSHQDIGVGGGAASVKVDSSGAISTKDDTAAPSGRLGVSIEAGGAAVEAGAGGVLPALSDGEATTSPTTGIAPENPAPPASSAATAAPVSGTGAMDMPCVSVTAVPLSARLISTLSVAGLTLVEACELDALTEVQRDALAANAALATWLGARGYGVGLVQGLAFDANRHALLVSRAYDSDDK